ncbi:MAG: hypothetical protein ACRELT_13125, partial [Longimicrobiales bacterium]
MNDRSVLDVHIVSHTHWDREWYLPFESFRERLIEVMDLVLDLVDDGGYPHFHCDGQIALLEDYLEACPERRADVERCVAEGKLSCGPWVT